jgi:hypothetical protein
MRFIKNILSRWKKEDKKVLGRWKLEECDIKRNKKIDQSNEDHCGPCGRSTIEKPYILVSRHKK